MLDYIRILHNTGAFQYQLMPLGLFGLECALMALTVLVVAALPVYALLGGSRKRRRCVQALIVVASCLVILAFIEIPRIASRTCFAEGYRAYLEGDVQKASRWYFRAIKWDREFQLPLEALVEICAEGPDDEMLLCRVAGRVRNSGQAHLCTRIGRLLGRAGKHAEAAELYEKAYRVSAARERLLDWSEEMIACEKGNAVGMRMAQFDATGLAPGMEAKYYWLKGHLELQKAQLTQAESAIKQAIALDPSRPQYHVTYANVLAKAGRLPDSARQMDQALELRQDLPAAHFALGCFRFERREFELAQESFQKAIYYDNEKAFAAILLEEAKRGRFISLSHIQQKASLKLVLRPAARKVECETGKSVDINIEGRGFVPSADIAVLALDPYGFGIETEVRSCIGTNADMGLTVRAHLSVRAKRPSRVNLGRPWKLNIVACDLSSGSFVDEQVQILVHEPSHEEGRIVFAITEDHEQTSGFGRVAHVTASEAKIELVDKTRLAEALAQRCGVRWSHVVDVGSSVLRLKWAQAQSTLPEWRELWKARRQSLIDTLAQGHDVQLHVHGYNIPGNRLSRQYYDAASQSVRFEGNVTRTGPLDGTHGAWAENFMNFGDWADESTRVGSVFAGINLLEGEIHAANPDYQVLFFRAGEYEFGKDRASVAQSIQALRMNQILADSDAHEGSPFRRDFKFFKPPGRNVYYTSLDSINDRATSLLDIGVLEILPVPEECGHDHLSPTSDFRNVKRAYDQCFRLGRVRPGVSVIGEMYHLSSANARAQWASLDPDYGDWRRINNQFKAIKAKCPKLECMTVSDVIKTCLDDLTPDLIVIRSKERRAASGLYQYDLTFLGRDIEPSAARPHWVAVKPPACFVGKIAQVEIQRRGHSVAAWQGVHDYADLIFKVEAKSGYSMHVALKDNP